MNILQKKFFIAHFYFYISHWDFFSCKILCSDTFTSETELEEIQSNTKDNTMKYENTKKPKEFDLFGDISDIDLFDVLNVSEIYSKDLNKNRKRKICEDSQKHHIVDTTTAGAIPEFRINGSSDTFEINLQEMLELEDDFPRLITDPASSNNNALVTDTQTVNMTGYQNSESYQNNQQDKFVKLIHASDQETHDLTDDLTLFDTINAIKYENDKNQATTLDFMHLQNSRKNIKFYSARKRIKISENIKSETLANNTTPSTTITQTQSPTSTIVSQKKKKKSPGFCKIQKLNTNNVIDSPLQRIIFDDKKFDNEKKVKLKNIIKEKYYNFNIFKYKRADLILDEDEVISILTNDLWHKQQFKKISRNLEKFDDEYCIKNAQEEIKLVFSLRNHFYEMELFTVFNVSFSIKENTILKNHLKQEHVNKLSYIIRIFSGFSWLRLNHYAVSNLYDFKMLEYFFISPLRYLKESIFDDSDQKIFFVNYEKFLDYYLFLQILDSKSGVIYEFSLTKINRFYDSIVKQTLTDQIFKKVISLIPPHKIRNEKKIRNLLKNCFLVFNKTIEEIRIRLNDLLNQKKKQINANKNHKLIKAKIFMINLLKYYVDRYDNADIIDSDKCKIILIKEFEIYINVKMCYFVNNLLLSRKESLYKTLKFKFEKLIFHEILLSDEDASEKEIDFARIKICVQNYQKFQFCYAYCLENLAKCIDEI